MGSMYIGEDRVLASSTQDEQRECCVERLKCNFALNFFAKLSQIKCLDKASMFSDNHKLIF